MSIPLARAIRGGWWADAFTLAVPENGIAIGLYATVLRAAEGFTDEQIDRTMLTALARRYGMICAAGHTITPEDAYGREEQRSGRALAEHDRRDGEGI